MIATCLTALAAFAGSELEAALDLLDRADHTVISANFEDATLEEVFDSLNRQSDIAIRPDWDELAGLGVDEFTTLTMTKDAARLGDVLGTIVAMLDDGISRAAFEAAHGEIVFTSYDATAAMALTAAYDVRDLLQSDLIKQTLSRIPERLLEPPDGALEEDAAAGDEDEENEADTEEGDDSSARPRRPLTPGEAFMLRLSDHVDPDAWIEYGGQRARYTDRHGVLLVTAPATVHRQLQAALRQLRRVGSPSGILLQAGIVELSRAEYDRIVNRYGPTSASGARAILEARDGRMLWQTNATASMDEEVSIESASRDTTIRLAMTPRFDADTGMLRLTVEAKTTEQEDVRTVSTLVSFPATRGAACIELPASSATETIRLLVLIPQRV